MIDNLTLDCDDCGHHRDDHPAVLGPDGIDDPCRACGCLAFAKQSCVIG